MENVSVGQIVIERSLYTEYYNLWKIEEITEEAIWLKYITGYLYENPLWKGYHGVKTKISIVGIKF